MFADEKYPELVESIEDRVLVLADFECIVNFKVKLNKLIDVWVW